MVHPTAYRMCTVQTLISVFSEADQLVRESPTPTIPPARPPARRHALTFERSLGACVLDCMRDCVPNR